MSNLGDINDWLTERFAAVLARNNVPGAAIAVAAGPEMIEHAAGVLSRATRVEATTDSLFQIGSITKVWTATLVMQLVDEGALDPDAPVRRYLPEFRLADESAAATITTRQLLCHVAGFEGDLFTDTGRGDDCVERYVATLHTTTQLFAPGELFSYNNAGYVVLGRIVEVLRGKPYDQCLRDHLIGPLGLTHTAPGADEAILHRAAVGHLQPTPDAEPQPAPIWSLVRSNAPAGSSLAMRPRDLLTFVRMHLDGGRAPDGTSVLSEASVTAMRERQVQLPDLGLMGTHWGLGWEMFDWPGGPVIGHDGGTIGQAAFLRVVPDRDIAITLLTNGGNVMGAYTEIFPTLLRELAGVQMPDLPTPPAAPARIDASRYVGTYSSEVADMVVTQDSDGRVWVETTPKGIMLELGAGVERQELVHHHGDTLVPIEPSHGIHPPHVFVGDDGHGRTQFLHHGRATRRTDQPA